MHCNDLADTVAKLAAPEGLKNEEQAPAAGAQAIHQAGWVHTCVCVSVDELHAVL
jgi:hypothetical protein